jgi:hypothetical protein
MATILAVRHTPIWTILFLSKLQMYPTTVDVPTPMIAPISKALNQCNYVINMNSTLIDAFLDLVLVAFKQSYKQTRIENLNSVFCKMIAWFVMKYGRTSADNREANCTTMALEWHPSQGFKLLVARLFQGAIFAKLAKHPIPNNNIVDIGPIWPLCKGIQGLDYARQ